MGSGKTTIGKLLARQLGYDFIDTDHIIEQHSGMTIQELFKCKGEKTFRTLETDVARELGAGQGMVISTGGKLMLDPTNAQLLGASGRVFCLIASPEETLRRVSIDSSVNRPLLDTANPQERIAALLQERQEGYRKFYQIVTTDKSPAEVTTQLINILHENPDAGGLNFTKDL